MRNKTYSHLFAHLAEESELKVGNQVFNGTKIGPIGNTGASKGIHLHHALVEGSENRPWHLFEMYEGGRLEPNLTQLNYSMEDDGLFGKPMTISSYYGDPNYKKKFGKHHYAYDCYPYRYVMGDCCYWNRTKIGTVLFSGWHYAYGWTVIIEFEA